MLRGAQAAIRPSGRRTRLKTEIADARGAEEKARLANKAAFRPWGQVSSRERRGHCKALSFSR